MDCGDQSLPNLDAAIRAYTLNAAYLMQQEHRVGSLKVGKRADIIVVDRNLFEIPTSQMSQTQVELTMLDGEIIFGESSQNLVFADGFESRNSDAWSITVL